jgi:hypothetical protein
MRLPERLKPALELLVTRYRIFVTIPIPRRRQTGEDEHEQEFTDRGR